MHQRSKTAVSAVAVRPYAFSKVLINSLCSFHKIFAAGVGDALVRIVKEEGVGGLFRGAGPTIVRAMSLNMGMLATNDQVCRTCFSPGVCAAI